MKIAMEEIFSAVTSLLQQTLTRGRAMAKKLFASFAVIALVLFACSSDSEVSEEIIFKCSDTNATAIPAADFRVDDIQCWIGEGENRAILVVQWNDGKEPAALVWGYRWNGTKYGIDMIMDIAKADNRFFLLTHATGPMGNTAAGFGYDISGNNSIQLRAPDGSLKTLVDGIVQTDAYDYDDWSCTDPTAHWKAGWYLNYWSYWVADNIGSKWEYSNLGASSRKLTNNSVDAWYLDLYTSDYDNSIYTVCAEDDNCDIRRDYFDDLTPATQSAE
jgi:hypothetical protein